MCMCYILLCTVYLCWFWAMLSNLMFYAATLLSFFAAAASCLCIDIFMPPML
jgi:hypothetical protein